MLQFCVCCVQTANSRCMAHASLATCIWSPVRIEDRGLKPGHTTLELEWERKCMFSLVSFI